jgi:lipopolysaccharide transport system ATP-binding protein
MGETAIRVEGLGKRYRIGARKAARHTFRERIADAFSQPFRSAWWKSGHSVLAEQESMVWALKDVSFKVAQGEVLGVIGRNGAGKSTLLKILSRITEPTEGCVELKGRVGSLLEVGTGFHSELTGRENIYLNGAILGMKKAEIERKFDEMVAFAGVERFIDTAIKHYSSGMHLRLGFAVAAHLQPEILLVDEVLAVGDAEFQKKCLGKMGEVAKEGRTVVFVSHNMAAVTMLCTQAVYLAEGQIRATGRPAAIISTYLTDVFQSAGKNLDQLRPPDFGKVVRFTEIALASEDGINLRFGQPIHFHVAIRSDLDMDNLSLGASIFSMAGACIGTLFTDQTFSIKAGRPFSLSLLISHVHLAPGSYYAGFSIGRGGRTSPRTDLDMVIGQPNFQVLPISLSDDPVANWNPGWGNVVFTHTMLTPLEE